MYAANTVGCRRAYLRRVAGKRFGLSLNNWGVIATMPARQPIRAHLSAYAQSCSRRRVLELSTPVSKFRANCGHHAVQVPKRGDWEVAHDIWLDDWNIEVMIWLYNHGRTPAGDPPALFISTGKTLAAWRDSSKRAAVHHLPELTLTARHDSHASLHLYGLLHAYVLARQMRINDIELGEEICHRWCSRGFHVHLATGFIRLRAAGSSWASETPFDRVDSGDTRYGAGLM